MKITISANSIDKFISKIQDRVKEKHNITSKRNWNHRLIDKKLNFNSVVAGGWSNEREISLLSGKNVFNSLKKNNFNAEFFDLKKNRLDDILIYKPNIIFNSLHGEFGEDGGLGSFALKNNIAITHSGSISSALCFNKRLIKNYLKKELKILSPKEIINKNHNKFPIISKPNWGGSSKGIKYIYKSKELKKIISNDQILLEEIITGKELTVTVMNYKNKIISLGVTEIEFDNQHYDYIAKYKKIKALTFILHVFQRKIMTS